MLPHLGSFRRPAAVASGVADRGRYSPSEARLANESGAVTDMTEQQLPRGLDPDILERVVTVEVDSENIEKMLHRAVVHGQRDGQARRSFSFFSDEPAELAGDDLHPYPLDYLTAAIGL